MFTCPHCRQQIISGRRAEVKTTNGVTSGNVFCTHCHAILHVEITTLHDPDPELLKTRSAGPELYYVYCPNCAESIQWGKEKDHKCSMQVQVNTKEE